MVIVFLVIRWRFVLVLGLVCMGEMDTKIEYEARVGPATFIVNLSQPNDLFARLRGSHEYLHVGV